MGRRRMLGGLESSRFLHCTHHYVREGYKRIREEPTRHKADLSSWHQFRDCIE